MELTGMLSSTFLKNGQKHYIRLSCFSLTIWVYNGFGMTLQNTVIQQLCYTLVLLQNLATYTTTANTKECMQSN